MFEPFPKLSRISQGWTITEKIDGTNAQILVTEDGDVFAGSRKRMITPEDDNFGFARWVYGNKETCLALGPGRHFGEWWGNGIQRGYGLSEKRFSLFNVNRWDDENTPDGMFTVPIFYVNEYFDDPVRAAADCMEWMLEHGSRAAPGFGNPEGVVLYHKASGHLFKKTYDYDEKGKWAENEARRDRSV